MIDVSRETSDLLGFYSTELMKWNAKINLIGRSTQTDVVNRHILDSLQLIEYASEFDHWVDLGAGAGFPGLVVAIALRNHDRGFTLIESDQRKAAFLSHITDRLKLSVKVLPRRIEAIEPLKADVISARALAPLRILLKLANRHGTDATTYIFPKGIQFETEIEEARYDWRFSLRQFPSKTAERSVILKIWDLRPVNA